MKTHIIQLEQHDDLISVRDKMSWAKSERILLIWPPRRNVNIRPLELVLLQRHADALGAQLGIASRSVEIRRSAKESHIPVFRTTSDAQLAAWGEVQKTQPHLEKSRPRFSRAELNRRRRDFSNHDPARLKNPVTRVGIFAIGVLAVLIFFILFLPSATIRINPLTQTQSVTIPITIDPDSSTVNISGVIPAHILSTNVEGNAEIPTTGMMTVPEMKAAGNVQFTNMTESRVQIPEGTIVRTVNEPAVRFIVTKSGEVPEGIGKKLELPVRAMEGGFPGNLKSNTLQAIEGTLGLSLSVTNSEPTSGGGEVNKSAATSEDRTRLYDKLTKILSNQAWEDIQKQVPAGGSLFKEPISSEPVSVKYDPPDGSPGSMLSLTLKQSYKAYYISESDLHLLAMMVLNASIPNGFAPLTGSLKVDPIGETLKMGDGKLTWQLLAERKIAKQNDSLGVISNVLGKTLATAVKNLSNLDLASSPQISISPPWWPWMPFIPARIFIEMQH
jgi:hypothetical protein